MKSRILELGDLVDFGDGTIWKVEMVNDCRARISCQTKVSKEFKDPLNDKMVKINVTMGDRNISPYSPHTRVGHEAQTEEEIVEHEKFLDTIQFRRSVRKPVKEEVK